MTALLCWRYFFVDEVAGDLVVVGVGLLRLALRRYLKKFLGQIMSMIKYDDVCF